MPSLVVIFGRDRGHHFDIEPGARFTIGRDRFLHHRLNDPSISRKHLELVHQTHNGKCMIVDLESRNGARINKDRLFRTQELNDGDIIQVGYTLLVFVCITFQPGDSIKDFLDDCEHTYEYYLNRMRSRTAIHIEDDASLGSRSGMSGTLNMGSIFGKKL